MTTSSHSSGRPDVLAAGVAAFAGILLVTVGTLHVLTGISALLDDPVFGEGIDYAYELDVTVWGWILLITGAIGVLTGIGILMHQAWGRIVGILVAFTSVVENFMFLPQSSSWSLVLIALGVLVIWALTTQIMAERPGPSTASTGDRSN